MMIIESVLDNACKLSRLVIRGHVEERGWGSRSLLVAENPGSIRPLNQRRIVRLCKGARAPDRSAIAKAKLLVMIG
jgi:hypothetical protein